MAQDEGNLEILSRGLCVNKIPEILLDYIRLDLMATLLLNDVVLVDLSSKLNI